MSIEDRLLLLLIQARQTGGDAALRDTAGLRSRLSSQAPDLHGEIQAMAAALAMGAPVRIAGAADAEAERQAIAADIARQEMLSMSVVGPGLAVACQGGAGIGPADPSPPPPLGDDWAGDSIVVGGDAPSAHKPGEDSWAGDSVAVGAAPSLDKGAPPPPQPIAPPPFAAPPPYPQPQPGPYHPPHGYGPGPYGAAAPKPFYTQTWFFVLIAAIIIAAAVGYTLWRTYGGPTTGTAANAPAAPVAPPVTKEPQPPVTPPQPDSTPRPGGPTLTPLESQPVRLPLQRYADGRVGIGFRVVAESGPIDGLIILPRGGWEGETTVLASNGADARSIGTGRLILQMTDDNSPARSMQVQWQQDGVGAGATEIAFASGAGQADVVLSGAGMCIADPTSGTIIGCGQIE